MILVCLPWQDRIELIDEADYAVVSPTSASPACALKQIQSGVFDSGEALALWDGPNLPSDQELREKYRWLAGEGLSPSRSVALEDSGLELCRPFRRGNTAFPTYTPR